jgi:hypothetical protein
MEFARHSLPILGKSWILLALKQDRRVWFNDLDAIDATTQ